ncbi:MAG: Fe-S cluster assembly protein SufD [Raineya sp.]|jgi:Fe-S cluster assembly protein SufD|nr:Fe-S cluster assembly protein SufD [Raineya sp.]
MTDTDKDFKYIFSSVAPHTTEYTKNARQTALQHLEALNLPTTKHEEWKYTNLKNLHKEEFTTSFSLEIDENTLKSMSIDGLEDAYKIVCVDGVFYAKYSNVPQNIEILSFLEAEKAGKLDNLFSSVASTENDYFNALNATYAQEGIYIRVPKNTQLDKPVVVFHLTDNQTHNKAVLVRNTIVSESGSEAKIAQIYQTKGNKTAFVSEVSEIFVAQNAFLDCYKIQNEEAQVYRVDTTQVHQSTYSRFAMTTISLKGALVRNNLNVQIDGEHCETYMNGLSYLGEKSHFDHHTLADHRKPNSYSNELYKGLFDGNSTGVFNGKIYVRQDAQKTNAYQQNRNVLLSENASIYTKPQLEIWADDVKCSHGATTGKLDETALFYMRARGISEKEAKKLLLKAFAGEILERIQIEPLKEYVETLIS